MSSIERNCDGIKTEIIAASTETGVEWVNLSRWSGGNDLIVKAYRFKGGLFHLIFKYWLLNWHFLWKNRKTHAGFALSFPWRRVWVSRAPSILRRILACNCRRFKRLSINDELVNWSVWYNRCIIVKAACARDNWAPLTGSRSLRLVFALQMHYIHFVPCERLVIWISKGKTWRLCGNRTRDRLRSAGGSVFCTASESCADDGSQESSRNTVCHVFPRSFREFSIHNSTLQEFLYFTWYSFLYLHLCI